MQTLIHIILQKVNFVNIDKIIHKRALYKMLKKEGIIMNNDKIFLNADDVAEELNISKPFAYKLIRNLNSELKAKGFVTISGKLSRKYFQERFYGVAN